MKRLLLLVIATAPACEGAENMLHAFWPEAHDAPPAEPLSPVFEGADAGRARIDVGLDLVASGFRDITDIQFPPGRSDRAIILEKGGRAWWLDVGTRARGTLLDLDVRTSSELGLLGAAFHPKFAENGKIYLNWNPDDGEMRTRISEWTLDPTTWTASGERVLLEIAQPYPNHNAGQLAFGPDGMLYIGTGDGGAGGDPHGHGQDRQTLLGDMLRIDVDRVGQDAPYGIPADNPFLDAPGVRPEIWAWGLRNPWRYSFDPHGRLIVADVGQGSWEEIDLVSAGANLGWNVREGQHCFKPARDCPRDGLTDPIYEYDREDGFSVTGGYVYTGSAVPALQGLYVFGDFGSGRIWAIDLPAPGQPVPEGFLAPVHALGRWPIHPATFGRDAQGELYVADFGGGAVYRFR